MKRDMDIIRDILLEVEAKDDGRAFVYEYGEIDVIKRHHINLLVQANLLSEVGISKTTQRKKVHLSWDGHDFVDAVRDKSTWEKTKMIAEEAGTFTLKGLYEVAKSVSAGVLTAGLTAMTQGT